MTSKILAGHLLESKRSVRTPIGHASHTPSSVDRQGVIAMKQKMWALSLIRWPFFGGRGLDRQLPLAPYHPPSELDGLIHRSLVQLAVPRPPTAWPASKQLETPFCGQKELQVRRCRGANQKWIASFPNVTEQLNLSSSREEPVRSLRTRIAVLSLGDYRLFLSEWGIFPSKFLRCLMFFSLDVNLKCPVRTIYIYYVINPTPNT